MLNNINFKLKKVSLACSIGLLLISGSTIAATSNTPFAIDSPYMLGDWGGMRSDLKNEGVDFQIGYTGEGASNFSGGSHSSTTARYADQWAFGMNLDLEKLLNLSDTEFQVTITNRNGRNLSDDAISDPRSGSLSSSQEVYGRGQTTRLTQLWIRQGYFDHLLDVKLGRVTVGEDFDSMQSNFQNLTMGAGAAGNWRGDHWYNWPIAQWGGRIKLNFTPEMYTQIGIYNQNPENYNNQNGFRLDTTGSVGNLVPLEFGWTPSKGIADLPGKYKIGAYYSSTRDPVQSNAIFTPGAQPQYEDTAHSYGGYFLVQQQLTSVNEDASRGLTLSVQGVLNDKKTSKVDDFQSIALTYVGVFDDRPEDELGFGVGRIHVNDNYTKNQQQQNAVNGVSDFNSATYLPIQEGSEFDYELYYRIKASKWLTVSPNLQYISAPGAVTEVKDAFVGGIAVNVTL